MRRIYFILVIASILLASCSTNSKQQPTQETIFVSILPLKYFTDQIVGDKYPVKVMVPPGASPATYAPTPKQMQSLSSALAYFSIGHLGFEEAWLDRIKSTNPAMETFTTAVGIDLLAGLEENHGDHVHKDGIDPHFWMSPKQARLVALNIFEGIVAIDPGNAEHYRENLHKLIEEIESVDEQITRILIPVMGKKFIIYHPALGYLAKDYGLEQLALEYEGKEPSTRHMQHLVEQARNNNTRLILIQKEFDQSNAKSFAKEINGEVVQIDPLDYHWPEQMIKIARILASKM